MCIYLYILCIIRRGLSPGMEEGVAGSGGGTGGKTWVVEAGGVGQMSKWEVYEERKVEAPGGMAGEAAWGKNEETKITSEQRS